MPQYTLLDPIRIGSDFNQAYHLAVEGIVLQTSVEPEKFQTITPHLFPCEIDSQLYNWLISDGKGDSWGIFIKTELEIDALAEHLEKLLIVTMQDDGRQVYFRFYDPRVLRSILPTSDTAQLKEIFGPIDVLYCEDKDDDYQLHFSFDGKQLQTDRIPIVH